MQYEAAGITYSPAHRFNGFKFISVDSTRNSSIVTKESFHHIHGFSSYPNSHFHQLLAQNHPVERSSFCSSSGRADHQKGWSEPTSHLSCSLQPAWVTQLMNPLLRGTKVRLLKMLAPISQTPTLAPQVQKEAPKLLVSLKKVAKWRK